MRTRRYLGLAFGRFKGQRASDHERTEIVVTISFRFSQKMAAIALHLAWVMAVFCLLAGCNGGYQKSKEIPI